MQAYDRAGNASAVSNGGATTVAAGCQGDSFEPGDDNQAQATTLPANTWQTHTFCPAGDVDWVKFDATAGKAYLVVVKSASGTGTMPMLTIYGTDSTTQMVNTSSPGYGQGLYLRWVAPASGTYFAKIQSADPGIAGNDISYQVYAGIGYWNYLPRLFYNQQVDNSGQ
jgi:hypothetical protein